MSKALTTLSRMVRDPFAGLFPRDEKVIWRAFDDLFEDLPFYVEDGWSLTDFPRSDVIYEGDKTIIELPLAGYSKEQLSVEVREGNLVISASKCEKSEDKSRLAQRAFQRTFWIGDTHATDQLTATFKDGLLKVEIPLTEPAEPKTVKVEIK